MIIKSNAKAENLGAIAKHYKNAIAFSEKSDIKIEHSIEIVLEQIISERRDEITSISISANGDMLVYFKENAK